MIWDALSNPSEVVYLETGMGMFEGQEISIHWNLAGSASPGLYILLFDWTFCSLEYGCECPPGCQGCTCSGSYLVTEEVDDVQCPTESVNMRWCNGTWTQVN